MFISLYKSLLSASEPLLKIHLERRVKKGKEIAERLNERFGIANIERGEKPVFWFHAASVGESISLLPVFDRMKQDYPQATLLLTTGTVSSAEMMAKRLPEGVIHQFNPLDNPKWVDNFLNHWQPNIVFWTDSEFWPATLDAVKKRNIPLILLNTRISKDSFNKWKFVKPVIKEILSAFTICLGPKNEIEKAAALGAPKVQDTDNIKYCTKAQPYKEAMLKELQDNIGDRPFMLWSSTHKGEEDVAIEIHKGLAKEVEGLLTIILPRHATRKEEIKELIEAQEVTAKFRSDLKLPSAEDDLYIADTMGETGLFYKLSDICVMGGTFAPIGGHNIIEPAHYACKIFYGPETFNFETVFADFSEQDAALQAKTKEAMQEVLLKALTDKEAFPDMGSNALKVAQEKALIIDNIFKVISPYIDEAMK